MQILSVIQKHGFTLEQVANRLNITKGSLSATINAYPNVKKMIDIAKIIGCHPGEFFEDWYENEGKDQKNPNAQEEIQQSTDSVPKLKEEQSSESEQETQLQGTTLVGLVRCPQCGRAIRLFAEE